MTCAERTCAPPRGRGDALALRRWRLATRRSIERFVFEMRTEIANICRQMADKNGEPPLSEQG
jgi:hypothetical protein